MTSIRIEPSLLLLGLLARVAIAQASAIIGVVRDSANQPVAGADVVLSPTRRLVRTDSLGRFAFSLLDAGQYVVRARRLGYIPAEWDVKLSSGGHVEVQLALGPRITMLDTVYVAGGRPCARDSYDGFLCRQAKGKGTFIDYVDIDTMDINYSAEILRDVGGFTVDVRPTRTGLTRVPSSHHCTIVVKDGVLVPNWSAIPEAPYMITGVEVYKSRQEIPKEFARYTWGKESCWLVAYWTYDFTYKAVRRVAPQRAASEP
jgi:hypothetical protein